MALVNLVLLLSMTIGCWGETVKFYFNNCVGDLYIHDYHNYTGKTIIPPSDVQLFSSNMFEFEYATRAEFGSYLDGNVNWRSKYETKANLVHYFFNVNETGGMYLDVEDHYTLGATGCLDVPDNGGTLPSIVGVYAYWRSNTTFDQCKTATNAIDECTYEFYVQ